jgi:hypothetical protein
MDNDNPDVAVLDPAGQAARREFLGWQCRLRQLSVRQADGRPTSGMTPDVSLPGDGAGIGQIIVLIRKKASGEVTARIQHMVRKTRDPAERRESALRFLAEAYYQRPEEFSDELTALFGPRSEMVDRLLEAGRCELGFAQFEKRYRLTCRVRRLAATDPGFEFTYWHNSLFNPAIPGDVQVLAFQPDWSG